MAMTSNSLRLLSLTRRAFSSSAFLKFDCGVSMDQGASRGIGLEFHMWPLLKVGGGFGTERSAAVVASLSARVGSIGDKSWGMIFLSSFRGWQVSKTASVEFVRKKDPIVCILLHRGTVDTDLSKLFQKNLPKHKLFTKGFSAQKLLSIINTVNVHDNGKFFTRDGQEIPW